MGNLLRILLALRAAAVFQRIDDADHPLATRMDMQLDGLLVVAPATPVLVQCLDQLELQAQQSSAIAPVNLDVRILHCPDPRSLFPHHWRKSRSSEVGHGGSWGVTHS